VTPLFASSGIYWHLPVLLIVFSLVYSATRHDRWDRILSEALGWALRVGGFLLAVGAALYIFSSYPDYWPYLLGLVVGLFAVYMVVTAAITRRRGQGAADTPAK
jgi:uncharacterized membrane protein YjfL (UPF0719 family)